MGRQHSPWAAAVLRVILTNLHGTTQVPQTDKFNVMFTLFDLASAMKIVSFLVLPASMASTQATLNGHCMGGGLAPGVGACLHTSMKGAVTHGN
jgi:hypothetical protein